MNLEPCRYCKSENITEELGDNGYCCVCEDCGAKGPPKSMPLLARDAWGIIRTNVQTHGQFYKVRKML